MILLLWACFVVDEDVETDPFADAIVTFEPGEAAGFGQDELPDIVLGSPQGTSDGMPSLDVLSLGRGGVIVLALEDVILEDGDGVDLIVFENPFVGWLEAGIVGVSTDGVTWTEWPCDPMDVEGGFPGCAGVGFVYAGPDGEDPTQPASAGGDGFDLADIGVAEASFVRIQDGGANPYEGNTGGFDLDAIAVIEH